MRKDGLERKQKKQLRKLKVNERFFSFMEKTIPITDFIKVKIIFC